MAVFPQQNEGSHPVSNWMAIITALTEGMPATNVPIGQLTDSILDVFKMLWITYALNAQSTDLVSNAQAAAVLAAFNTAYGGAPSVSLPAATLVVRSRLITKWQADLLKTANAAFIAALSV